MLTWRVMTLDHRDATLSFEDVVELIDEAGIATGAPYSRSDVIEALSEHQPACVAISTAGTLVGAVIARVGGPDAHLLALALHPSWRQQGIGS